MEGLSQFITEMMDAVRVFGLQVVDLTLDAADIYDPGERDRIRAEVKLQLEGRWPDAKAGNV